MGLRGAAHAAATADLESSRQYQGLLDFPTFLELYATHCGLASPDLKRGPTMWVPSLSGTWREIEPTVVDTVFKAAEPYSSSLDAIDQSEKSGSSKEVWISTDDVADVLLLAGTSASEAAIGETVRAMRNLLPGVATGKFSLQELVAVFRSATELPAPVNASKAQKPVQSRRPEGFSKPLKPQHGTRGFDVSADLPATDPFAGGKDDSIYRSRDSRGSEHSTPVPEAKSTWTLPFRDSAKMISKQAMEIEFRKLDLRGDGRLTFLPLKSALELMGVHEDDQTIRRWLREADSSQKGYVDFSDYERIYVESRGHVGGKAGTIGLHGTLEAVSGGASRHGSSSLDASSSLAARAAAAERAALLKR